MLKVEFYLERGGVMELEVQPVKFCSTEEKDEMEYGRVKWGITHESSLMRLLIRQKWAEKRCQRKMKKE